MGEKSRLPVSDKRANTLSTSETARALNERAHRVIPGGAHVYAKGDDQFPMQAPPFIARGSGSHSWDIDGKEFIEYGMGLRAVTLGHGFAPIVDAVRNELPNGVNFSRPSPIEVECAEQFLELVPTAEMVKFCKNGSDATDGAVRLARAYTGRDRVAICGDHPFFSTNDWFIGSTEMNAGIPEVTRRLVGKFNYNDIASLEALFAAHPGEIACVLMEAARTEEPSHSFLEKVKAVTNANGALLVFDEMITGFRWHLNGAQHVYGVTPDLSAFGKALANGFSVSALAGRREVMQLGSYQHDRKRVFLLSSTHGAETHHLAGALATMRFYRDNPVIATLYARGARLRKGFNACVAKHGLEGYVESIGRDCNLLFVTRDADKQPSQLFRTLFMQEMIKRGIIAPSFVVSFSHAEADIDRTIAASDEALSIYRRALSDDVNRYLDGRPVQPVFSRFGTARADFT